MMATDPVPDTPPSVLGIFADPAHMADPYPLYREVLARQPVQDVGAIMLTRYDDVVAGLRHPGLSSDDRYDNAQRTMVANGELRPEVLALAERRSLLHRDPPEHTGSRAAVDRVLAESRWPTLPGLVAALVDDAIDRAAPRGRIDLVGEFAFPVPLAVICRLLDVPPGDHVDVPWARAQMCADFEGPPAAGADCADYTNGTQARMTEYFDRIIADRRRHPGDDLVSALLEAESRGELTVDEVNDTCRLLLVSGQETVTDLIAAGALALLRHPDQLGLVRADPDLAPALVEEALRFDPPVQFVRRVAREDLDVNGTPVAKGQMALLWLGAASRDDRYAAPDDFDVTGAEHGHLQFGLGVHACPGAWLARTQARVALTALARRLVGPRLEREPTYMPRAIHAIEDLPVAFDDVLPREPAHDHR